MYDSIVIGAGPAGMSAALFMARAQLKVLLIGEPAKAGLAKARNVGNYIGTDGITGQDWLLKGLDQITKYGAEYIKGEVVHVYPKNDFFAVKTPDKKEFEAKTIVVCVGVAYLPSGILNEEAFAGRGIHYCVACDGIFYKNKNVLVVGNGNFAAEEAIELLAFTKNITICSNGAEFKISKELMDELKEINFIKDRLVEFQGEKNFKKAKTSENKILEFDGVFLAIGTASALSFANKLALNLDKNKAIIIDRFGKTSVKGVYAAGSCTGGYYQIAKSVGEGCSAAISIIKELKGLNEYMDLS